MIYASTLFHPYLLHDYHLLVMRLCLLFVAVPVLSLHCLCRINCLSFSPSLFIVD